MRNGQQSSWLSLGQANDPSFLGKLDSFDVWSVKALVSLKWKRFSFARLTVNYLFNLHNLGCPHSIVERQSVNQVWNNMSFSVKSMDAARPRRSHSALLVGLVTLCESGVTVLWHTNTNCSSKTRKSFNHYYLSDSHGYNLLKIFSSDITVVPGWAIMTVL